MIAGGNHTKIKRVGTIADHARHDLAVGPAAKSQFTLPAKPHPLPALGKLSLAKLWESAYNETVYAAFFWSCLETMVKTGGVCVVENQALVDVWGAAIAYRRMGLAVL